MRLVTFEANGHPRAALLRDGRLYDIWGDASRGARSTDRTVEAILEGGLLGEIEPVEGDEGVPVEGVELLPPLTRPGKLICIGLNYRGHAEEQGVEPPETPTFFAKFRNALAAAGATVKLPDWSQKVDYEAEVAFVIRDRCKDVPESRRDRPHRRLHAAQRPVGARLPVQDASVDARQDLRRRLRPAARRSSLPTRPARTTRSRSS